MNPSGRGTNRVSAASGDDLFVGREDVLGRLGSLIDAAASGRGGIALICGEPGMGKSRLLRAVAEAASRRGFRVGSATNFENARSPFAPLMDGLRGLLDGHAEALPRAAGDRAALLGLMGAGDVDPPATLDKRRLFVTVADTLTRLADRVPWLLLIDDAQWSDPETLEFIEYLAPRITGLRGAVVVAHRPAAEDPHLVNMSTRVASVESLTLAPLTLMESRLLIAALDASSRRLRQELVDDIAARAEGSPLFIEELIREGINSPSARSRSLQHTTLAKLDKLDRSDRSIIEAASVIGRTFDIETLAAICDTDVQSVLGALRAARDEHIVEECGEESSAFRFRHELLRRAVYDRMLTAQRQTLHRRIADRLDSQSRPSHELVATHWLAAGDLVLGAVAAEAAGDNAMAVDAITSARDRYLDAERTQILSGHDLGRLKEKLGRAFDLLGDSQAASERLTSAAEFFNQIGSLDRSSALMLRVAIMKHRSRHMNEALEVARGVLASSSSSATQFAAHALLAMIFAFEDEGPAARVHVTEAERISGDRDPNSKILLDYAKIALARFSPGDDWIEPTSAVVEHAAETGDPSLLAHALINFGIVACERGRSSAGIAALKRAVDIADRNGRTLASAYARIGLIVAYGFEGKLNEAYEVILAAGALHVDALELRLNLAGYAIPILAELGRLELFPQFVDGTLIEEARAADDARGYAVMVAAQLYASWSLGQPADNAKIGDALARVSSPSNLDLALLWFACFAPGEHLPRIDELVGASLEYSEQIHICRTAAQAVIHQRERRSDRAATSREAIDAARKGGARMVEALVLEMSGNFKEARKLYAACGAATSLDRLRIREHSLLTPREREIAALVAQGKTNRQIADMLVLSERTVEHHASAVLRKFGLTGRDDLAKRLDD